MRWTINLRGGRGLGTSVSLLCLSALVGCAGDLYPVQGKVLFADGTPLSGGQVICETKVGDKTFLARGELQADGTFQLGTDKPGDGARPGKYRVLVAPEAAYEPDEARGIRAGKLKGPSLDERFRDFHTSGLELEVKPGRNEVTLTVTKPGKRPR